LQALPAVCQTYGIAKPSLVLPEWVIDHTSICFNNPPLADLAINPAPGLCRCEQSAGCRPTDGFDTQLLLLWSKLKNVMQIVVQCLNGHL
jgi:hypothetical protein